MRFQLFILSGLAFAYATGAYYTASHTDASTAIFSHQACTELAERGVGKPVFRDGDILFQTSNSQQSQAIQLATHSRYSHCGIVFYDNGVPYVYEAVQPVTITPLSNWTNGRYAAKRLKNADKVLNKEVVQKMKAVANSFYGKDYDVYFDWSDDELYCSELVYKIYERGAGIKIGELKQLKDYDLSNALVKEQLEQRYGQNIPYDEAMISPGAIYESNLLTNVESK